jgi:hypothetical protein
MRHGSFLEAAEPLGFAASTSGSPEEDICEVSQTENKAKPPEQVVLFVAKHEKNFFIALKYFA